MRFCTVSILLQKASMHLPYILFVCILLFLIIGMGEPLRIGQTPAAHAPGAQIFEGKGQAKRTRMKRKMSEHASSIGSDEQNLDIPKRLKSSQAPESNEPTCGAVAQYASGTCTTVAPGLQNRGKRMIRVSSKQSGTWQSKLGA